MLSGFVIPCLDDAAGGYIEADSVLAVVATARTPPLRPPSSADTFSFSGVVHSATPLIFPPGQQEPFTVARVEPVPSLPSEQADVLCVNSLCFCIIPLKHLMSCGPMRAGLCISLYSMKRKRLPEGYPVSLQNRLGQPL